MSRRLQARIAKEVVIVEDELEIQGRTVNGDDSAHQKGSYDSGGEWSKQFPRFPRRYWRAGFLLLSHVVNFRLYGHCRNRYWPLPSD
ncbi:MAG: hypothetical protein WBW85_21940 [Terriglobales bacterium]